MIMLFLVFRVLFLYILRFFLLGELGFIVLRGAGDGSCLSCIEEGTYCFLDSLDSEDFYKPPKTCLDLHPWPCLRLKEDRSKFWVKLERPLPIYGMGSDWFCDEATNNLCGGWFLWDLFVICSVARDIWIGWYMEGVDTWRYLSSVLPLFNANPEEMLSNLYVCLQSPAWILFWDNFGDNYALPRSSSISSLIFSSESLRVSWTSKSSMPPTCPIVIRGTLLAYAVPGTVWP